MIWCYSFFLMFNPVRLLFERARPYRFPLSVPFILLFWLLAPTPLCFAQYQTASDTAGRRLAELNEQLRLAGERGNHAEAESCMDSMIRLMEQIGLEYELIRERAHLRIQYSMSLNRLRSARDAALAWIERHPEDLAVRRMLGTIYQRMALDAKAEEQIKAVYEADPTNVAKQREYLRMLMRGTDRDRVFRLCEQILKTNGNNVSGLIDVAEAYLHFQAPERAKETVNRIEQIEPERPYIKYSCGKIFQQQGEFEKAANIFAAIPRGHPDWFDSHYRLGSCLFRLRRYEDAAYVLVDVLRADPYHTAANARLEQVLRRLRKRQGAKVLYDLRTGLLENMELIELEATGYKRRGMLAEQTRLEAIVLDDKRRYRAAEHLLVAACESLPESIEAKENLAEHHLRTVQACRAETIYRDLARRFPPATRGRIIVALAQSLLRQGKTDEPVRLLEEASSDNDLRESLLSLLGSYYLEIEGDCAKALTYFERVESASPEVRAAHARSLMGVGEFDRAWEILERLPSDFDDPVSTMAKVECLARLDQPEPAKSIFEETVERHPDLSPFVRARAEACLAGVTGATDQAELETRASQLDASLQRIRELVKEANRKGWPDSIPVLLNLSDVYLELAMDEEALKYAQLAWQGDFSRVENHRRVIERMTQPNHALERLHEIDIHKRMAPNSAGFEEEIAEALGHLELSPVGP